MSARGKYFAPDGRHIFRRKTEMEDFCYIAKEAVESCDIKVATLYRTRMKIERTPIESGASSSAR